MNVSCSAADFEGCTAQKTISDTEMRYRALMETASDGVWVTDAQGRLLAVNDAYVRLSGHSREELLSMRIDQLSTLPADDIAAHIADVRRQGARRSSRATGRRTGASGPLRTPPRIHRPATA